MSIAKIKNFVLYQQIYNATWVVTMSIVTNNLIYGISVQKSYTFMYGITYILFIILIEIKNSIDLHTIPYLILFLYILLYYI